MAPLEEAIAVARELGMRALEARGLVTLGQAHLLVGRPKEAQPHLAEAVSLFRAAAMDRWLAPAEALLAATA
jgi:hypothetical protein